MEKNFNITHKPSFSKHDLEFWSQYGIGEDILSRYGVHSVSDYSYKSDTGRRSTHPSESNELVFSYEAKPGECYKIYRPTSTGMPPKFSWLGTKPPDFIFGLDQLPATGEEVFITGGEKDVLTLAALGYPAITLNSETANPDPGLIQDLKKRFRKVTVLYDLDDTGLQHSERISRQFGLSRFILPAELKSKGGKDVSDLIKMGLSLDHPECRYESFDSLAAGEVMPQGNLRKLLVTQARIREQKRKQIAFAQPILLRGEDPVLFPRTINVLQGKAGVHKSRLAETICSAFLRRSDFESPLLGFKPDRFTPVTTCYVDTERNTTDQLPYALQQIQRLAGYDIEDEPQRLDFISVIEIDREERFDAINEYVAHVRDKFDGHLLIVLDVTTDCIQDFNRSSDSMKLIDLMNKTINEQDVTFLCLIHENPGNTDKARGHLGTEILNKASTVIQVGFEKGKNGQPTDIVGVRYLKCRNSRKHPTFYVQYNPIERRLELADQELINDVVQSRQQKANLAEVVENLIICLGDPMPSSDLVNQLAEDLGCSDRIIRDRLKEIMESGMHIHNQEGKPCTLAKDKIGRGVSYYLAEVGADQT